MSGRSSGPGVSVTGSAGRRCGTDGPGSAWGPGLIRGWRPSRPAYVRQGYIPGFIAGFREVELVGTCDRLDNPAAPVWSRVHLTNIEVIGCGTLAYDPHEDRVAPHIHVSVGLKEHSATAHTSHLLGATVQFLTELLVIETTAPQMHRVRDSDLYDVPLLQFGS